MSSSMSTPPGQVIDLTGRTAFEWAEVRTDAGIVRVNVGLVATQGGQPSVVVEVEPNAESAGVKRTPAGGDWAVEVQHHEARGRTDVTLRRSS
jgi:hypothetical protein